MAWIIQYDPSSQIKEYVNRVGRTARLATEGNALTFLLPSELEYVKHMKKKYKIDLYEKARTIMQKAFETKFKEKNPTMKHQFRKLVNIADNIDE